jgi:hypothetical protein
MVDDRGYFYPKTEDVYAHARLDEAEAETRAQIELALAAGIDVTHLDSHMGTMQLDPRYHALYVRLAVEYRVPLRMARRSWLERMGMGEIVAQADHLGVLRPDHFCVGGPPSPEVTPAYWTQLLQELRPGVSELYIHAAFDTPEMRGMTDQWRQRQADFDYFTDPRTAALLAELGITLIGYRALRAAQRRLTPC